MVYQRTLVHRKLLVLSIFSVFLFPQVLRKNIIKIGMIFKMVSQEAITSALQFLKSRQGILVDAHVLQIGRLPI